jgi:hypothetical protein
MSKNKEQSEKTLTFTFAIVELSIMWLVAGFWGFLFFAALLLFASGVWKPLLSTQFWRCFRGRHTFVGGPDGMCKHCYKTVL